MRKTTLKTHWPPWEKKWNDWAFLRNLTIILLKFFAIKPIFNINPILKPFGKNLGSFNKF